MSEPAVQQQVPDHIDRLLARHAAATAADRVPLREQIVLHFLPLAHQVAHRYAYRGVPTEDLRQVSALALLKAIDRFDPRCGGFLNYAFPTITGELKRHFRDYGWTLKVSRRIKDRAHEVSYAQAQLTQKFSRTPTLAELAECLGLPADEVREVLDARQAYSVISMDAPAGRADGEVGDDIGCCDPDLEAAETIQTLRPALARLPRRERLIIGWRFYEGLTQQQVATRLGISQMHVSRLQARALARLRTSLDSRSAVDSTAAAAAS